MNPLIELMKVIEMNPLIEVIDLDLLAVDLGKWPRLLVVGKPVTAKQAMEILIRTDNLQLSSNDREFSTLCANYLYEVKVVTGSGSWSLTDGFDGKDSKTDWVKYQEARSKVEEELQLINLNYLRNEKITSCYVGGPNGWCNWDGQIDSGGYNIGKWPTVENVYREWQQVAQAFPYLDLKCQLITEEGDGKLVVEYQVKGGVVSVSRPGPLLRVIEELTGDMLLNAMYNPTTQRGCTFEHFKKAVEYTRTQIKARTQ